MTTLALSAVGRDRPGIVAAVTGVLADLGCNLADSSMSLLGGHFAMVLLVEGAATGSEVEARLAGVAADLDLVVAVREVADAGGAAVAGERWSISVYGADHPGIVHGITSAVADFGGNIVDLATHVIEGEAGPVYAMFLEVGLAIDAEEAEFASQLGRAAELLGVDCSIRRVDADVL